MLTELACYNQDATFQELLETIFISCQKEIDSVAIPSGFMNRVNDFLKDQKFSAAIDFPYGVNGTQVRVHEIILAIRQGASYIDLVLNSGLIKDKNWHKIKEDLKACMTVCKTNDVELRVITEYRLFDTKTLLLLCDLVYGFGVYNMINSTGFIADDLSDNALISHEIQSKTGMNVTACGRFTSEKHFKMLKDADIYGLRLMSPRIAEDLL